MTVEGYKHFIDAESMSAFDVNAFLMSQAVTRFETAADRDAALEQVVTEGMVSYNKDTGELQLYDGTAWQTVAVGSVGVTDHGALTGLGDDDHPHYLTEARGDARYYTESEVDSALAGYLPLSGGTVTGDITYSATGRYATVGAWPTDGNWAMFGGANGYLLVDGNYSDDDVYLRSYNSTGNINIGAAHTNTLVVGNGSITVNGTGYATNWSVGTGSSTNSFVGGSNYWRPQDAYGNSYFDINSGQFYVDSDTYYFRNRASANSLVIDSAGNGTFTGGVYTSNWFRAYGEEGLYSQSYGQHFYPDSGGFYWDIDGPLRVRSGYEGGIQGYLGYHDGNGFGLLHSGGAWWLNTQNNNAHLVIGGSQQYNPYNSVTSRRLMFGGGDSNAQGNYYIGTNLENYGGNYNKLDMFWHTGIRMAAMRQYGGIRMYGSITNSTLSDELFSVGKGDGNVRVTNILYIGDHAINAVPGTGNPYGSINVGGAMQWDGYAIDQRFVFMYEGATRGGIYDDASNEWHVESTTNAQTNIMHNGATRVQTENAGVYIAGKLRAYRNSSGSDTGSMQVEALSAATSNRTAGFTGHIPNYLAPVLRVWTGAGEGFDCGNYAGNAYAFLGASSFVTRSSERWKKNIQSRSDDEIIPTALALLSCRTARWDDINLEPVYCEEQMCLVQPEMCDDPNCECECCTAIKTNPIQDRHFNRRGYVVEELAEVFPDAIHYEEDGRPSGIDYSVLTAELIDIVKLLVLQCDAQEQRIVALEGAA